MDDVLIDFAISVSVTLLNDFLIHSLTHLCTRCHICSVQIIRQIRAVKAGVKELGGDLERDGNPVLKNHRLTVGTRPYMLIPQRPGEYRDGQLLAMERERLRLLEEERLR